MTRSQGTHFSPLHYLYPALAGAILFWSGWSSSAYLSVSAEVNFQPQLVIRPVGAELVTLRGQAPRADGLASGRFTLTSGNVALELRQSGVPPVSIELEEPPGMTTVRAPLPRATLAVSVQGDEQAEVTVLSLPEKTELPTAQGQIRLDPGPHELLVQAKGYLPKRLTVELKAGERKDAVVALEALPNLGPFPAPSFPSAPQTRPPSSPPPTWEPPPSIYLPPSNPRPAPSARPSAPVPVPRFTPVAPPPQPEHPAPVPMFTPIGN